MKVKIPASTIGLLSQIMSDNYSHSKIDSIFLTASAPDNIPEGSKPIKVMKWLRDINNECENPLEVLGNIIDDFMDNEHFNHNSWENNTDDEYTQKRREAQEKIIKTLSKDGLSYARGGYISKGGSIPTISLQESVEKRGLSAVEIEINQALDNVEKDPMVAVHNAGSVLEAVFKNYLEHHKIVYSEKDTLAPLWDKVATNMNIRKKLENEEVAKIVSGLNKIVDGILHLRNKKSSAHGKSERQIKTYKILPRHSRLAIHSAHTVSAYVLELLEES